MRRVFDCWPEIASRVRSAGTVALFLDFDGTLAPIRPTPDEARLTPPTRIAITRLAANMRARVWVISGRLRADVRDKTRVPRVEYLGLHGWDAHTEGSLAPETRRVLADVKRTVADRVSQLRGVWMEDKGSALAIHYRCAAEAESNLVRASVRDVMARLNGNFRLLDGKKVWEILPREVGDKGSAVRRELSRLEHRPLPIYIGDDLTDESAFSVLPDGLTVRVGRCSLTRAQYQLADPGGVRRFLEKLEAELS